MNYTNEEILKFLSIIDNYKNNEEVFFSNKVRCKSSKKSDFFH